MTVVREEFVFLSDWMNRKVYDSQDNIVGKLTDVIAETTSQFPPIQAFVIQSYKIKKLYKPSQSEYELWIEQDKVIIQKEKLSDLVLTDDQFLLRDWLWDRQVVDISGAKVKRVNDVQLLIGADSYIVHVDVGFTGLLRRLGFERPYKSINAFFGKKISDELVSWKFITPVQAKSSSPLKLIFQVNNLRNLHPAELADVLEDLNSQERTEIVRAVGAETAAAALEVADEEVQKSVLESLTADESAHILEEMELPTAADVLEVVRQDVAEAVLAAVEPETREDISELAAHEEETAGSVMSTDFISCLPTQTSQEVLDKVKELAFEIEAYLYVYVIDEENNFLGVVSLRSILTSPATVTVEKLMHRKIYSISPTDTLEDVAELFLTYEFAFCPVVENNTLTGVISLKHAFKELLPYIWRKRND